MFYNQWSLFFLSARCLTLKSFFIGKLNVCTILIFRLVQILNFLLSFDCSSVADVSNFLFKLDDATNLVKEHENSHSVDDFTDPIRSQFPQRLLQMLKLFIFNVKK